MKIILFFLFTLVFASVHAEKRNFTLVIDAGHGGHDSGAVGSYSKEKNINLNVALAFGRLVADNCPDVRIIYTRRNDVFIPLQRRADIANENKADLFISIHTNALPNGRIAYGSETYSLGMARAAANLDVAKRENSVITLESDYKRTYEGFDPNKAESYVIFEIMQDRYMQQSVDLAKCIQTQYRQAGRQDKGVHQAGFLVLRNTSMPSVLTELGFISTPAEEQYLNSKQGIAELSRSIYNGFLAYRRKHDKSNQSIPQNVEVRASEPNELPSAVADQSEVAVVPVSVTPTAELRRNEAADSSARRSETVEQAPEKNNRNASESKNSKKKPEKQTTQKGEKTTAKQDKPSTQKTSETKSKQTAQSKTKETDKKKNEATTAKSSAGTKKAAVSPKILYRIQVGAGKKEIAANDPQFKGLTISRVKEGSFYKYFYSSCSTYAEAQKALRTANAKIPGSYIVAYVDGKPVSVKEAREKENSKSKTK